MKKAGLSVLLAVSLIDSAEGARHTQRGSQTEAQKGKSLKEGDIVFS